jgi:hypothetical protein
MFAEVRLFITSGALRRNREFGLFQIESEISMRNEFSNKRVSALSILQREIVSTRCKAIDLDFPFYCERCRSIYLIVEETASPLDEKVSKVTKRMAGLMRNALPSGEAKALIVRFFDDSSDFDVKDLDSNQTTRMTREALADFIMNYRDAHDAVCPHPDAGRETWAQEKAANQGSPWRDTVA